MDLEDFAQHIQAWHSNRVGQLQQILDHKDAPIRLEGAEGTVVEITGEQAKGFRAGVRLSLELLGTLPFSVTQDEEE